MTAAAAGLGESCCCDASFEGVSYDSRRRLGSLSLNLLEDFGSRVVLGVLYLNCGKGSWSRMLASNKIEHPGSEEANRFRPSCIAQNAFFD